jgi:ABC-type Fe3+-hydroxamate transport system substrate-binding protein
MQNRTFTDQLNREVSITYSPCRIISLVPSQTELLFYLGLDQEIVGLTKFCIHPEDKFKSVTKVGGTKKLNLKLIRELKPDLIIGNKEENDRDQIEELSKEFPVWMSDIYTLDDALDMISKVGELVNKQKVAKDLVSEIDSKFKDLALINSSQGIKSYRVAYFIWKDPYMIAASGTFINDILLRMGLENAFELERYPQVSEEDIQHANPDLIFLSSEPYPFREKHVFQIQKICPNAKVLIVDGEMFSWYGSRLLEAPAYLKNLMR